MQKQLVVIDPKEFGLEESKAHEIASQFKPMLDKMIELEKEFNEIVALPIEDKATSAKAKELRLKYVKVRTGTAEIHKKQKAFYLAGGKFVDGWKNAQLFASQGIEEKLESIEKHFENMEIQRVNNLRDERIKLLEPYNVENLSSLGLGIMSEQVWLNFLQGTKANHEAKIEAEKKAEELRIEMERVAEEKRQEMIAENKRLREEAEAKEKELAKEREANEAKLKEEQEKARIEREEAEKEAKRIRAEQDVILEKERQERIRIEKELEEKKAEQERLAKEAEEKAEAELSKGDSEKIKDLLADLKHLKEKYVFKSAKSNKMYSEVGVLLDKIINHINK